MFSISHDAILYLASKIYHYFSTHYVMYICNNLRICVWLIISLSYRMTCIRFWYAYEFGKCSLQID